MLWMVLPDTVPASDPYGERMATFGRRPSDCACEATEGQYRQARKPRQSYSELAPSHSITSSARSRIEGGIVMPSSCAVLRLTMSLYVGGPFDRQLGYLGAWRMRSMYSAPRVDLWRRSPGRGKGARLAGRSPSRPRPRADGAAEPMPRCAPSRRSCRGAWDRQTRTVHPLPRPSRHRTPARLLRGRGLPSAPRSARVTCSQRQAHQGSSARPG